MGYSSRPAVADLLLLAAVWVAAVLLVDPRGDFPLNDDWAYAVAVERLLTDGVFRPPGWAGMTLLTQALWGAAAAAIAGFSHTVLRLSTLVLGGAAVLATYLLAGRLGATRGMALFAALVVTGNPLFVALSHTFMTDVPMLALMLGALLCSARALQDGSLAAWAAATLLAVAAVLCRQPAIVLPLGFAAAVLLRRPDRRRWLLPAGLSILLVGGALWGFQVAMQAAGTLPAAFFSHAGFLLRLWHMGAGRALPLVLGNLGVALLYAGLFLLPLLVAYAPGWRAAGTMRWRRGGAIAGAAAAVAVVGVWSSGRRMPLRGNVLIESGLGPVTLNDWYIRGLANDPRLPPAFWWAATACAIVGVALLAAQGAAAIARTWGERHDAAAPTAAVRTLLLASVGFYLAITCVAVQFDRYLLPLVPLLGVALLPPDGGRTTPRRRFLGAAVLLAPLAGYAVAGTHDYLAWNRARWQALQQLADAGVAATRIDGGLEFNAPHFYVEGDGGGGGGRSWWWVADDEYLIAMGPVPGYTVERRVPYRRWLPPVPAEIAVLRRAAPAP
jgi:4-amino-4-deoxy-L-arabinose transferase-like glycosyltransferase